jgi:hypothetical protein
MSIIKITSLALSIALGMSLTTSPGFAATKSSSTNISVAHDGFQTAHLKNKKKHRHCHTGIRNHRLIKTCHRHRHWPLHHVRKG